LLLPSALAGDRAYRQAPVCAEDTPSQECRWRREAVVADKWTEGTGKSKDYFVRLVLEGDSSSAQSVRFATGGSHFGVVESGDRVTTTSWRGAIREFTAGTEQVPTSRYPVGRFRGLVLAAIFLLPMGASLLWAAHWLKGLRRRGLTIEAAGIYHTSVPFASSLCFSILAAIPVAASSRLPVTLAAVTGIAVVVLALAALSWRRGRRKLRGA
jgi:hypothetical protein